MVDYKNGKIYKISCDEIDKIYIGSTCKKLSERFSKHQSKYKSWRGGKRTYTSSYELLKYPNAKITLLEEFPCESKIELIFRERYYIEQNNCVNILRLLNSTKKDKSEYRKQRRKNNLNQIEYDKQYGKNYRLNNSEYFIKYNIDHAKEKKEKSIIYRRNNAEKINTIIECECGTRINKCRIQRHRTSKKHLDLMIKMTVIPIEI